MKKIYFLILISLLINCTDKLATLNIKDALNNRIQNTYDLTSNVRILFGTLRRTGGSDASCSNSYYSNQLDTVDKFGYCEISVPANHEVGSLDQDAKGKPDDFFKMESHKTLLNIEAVSAEVMKNEFPEAIVFVHGFNVKFEEAILRAAQIKYDLKFSGEVILYTWPAGADEGLLSALQLTTTYKNNQNNAKSSINSLKNFLSALEKTGKKIHLIVHSMGHQVAFPAIASLQNDLKKKFLYQSIFNAPDFDSEEFKKIKDSIIASSERSTIYCSPGDNALVASSKVNSTRRVGSCEKFSGIDVINVNPVDAPVMGIAGLGHGYYSSKPILTELYQVILGVDASRRLFIRKSSEYNGENFVLRR